MRYPQICTRIDGNKKMVAMVVACVVALMTAMSQTGAKQETPPSLEQTK